MRTNLLTWYLTAVILGIICLPVLAVPLTITQSVEIALQGNEEIKAVEEKQWQAKYGVMESVGNFLPSVSLSTAYSRAEGGRELDFPIATRADLTTGEILYESSVRVSFMEEESHDTKLEVVQPIFQGGALWSQLGLARTQRRAAGFELQAKRSEIALRVKEAYCGVLEAENLLEAMDEAVDLSREHLRVAQSLYEAGMAGRAETLRGDVLLSFTLQDSLRAVNGLIMARRAFNSLLNYDLDREVFLTEVEETRPLDLTLDECVQVAFESNPALRGFQTQLTMAGKSVSLARSSFLPKVNLVLDYGWYEDKYRFDPDDDYWMLMGLASWEIFAGTRNLARYKQSKAGYRQAEHELKAFGDGLELQVTQAYLDLQEATGRLDMALRALASAEENYRVNEASYREGMATQVDKIDAQMTLTEARVNYASTRYEIYKVQARLESLMGLMPF